MPRPHHPDSVPVDEGHAEEFRQAGIDSSMLELLYPGYAAEVTTPASFALHQSITDANRAGSNTGAIDAHIVGQAVDRASTELTVEDVE
jgi:hypothetical protein